MRTKSLLFVLLFTLGTSTWALGAEKFKIAYVNMQLAINSSNEGQKATEYLKAKGQDKEKEFRAKGMDVTKKQEALQASMMLSEEARQKQQEDLERMKNSLREEVQKAQEEYRQEEIKHLQRISQEVLLAVKKIGEQGKYDLVMEANLRQALLYTPSEVTDITDEVIKEYNKMKTGGK